MSCSDRNIITKIQVFENNLTPMNNAVTTTVNQLAPGFYVSSLIISVDRIFIREDVASVGDPVVPMKYQKSVDLLCWDQEVN